MAGINAAALGLALGSRGEIQVNDEMRTNLPNVFAIGDVVGGKLLAHKAEEEGVIAVEVIAKKPVHMHYHNMPAIVYTWPEIATAGLAEHEVKASGRAYKVGKFPFSANGRARTMAETSGFVKFVSDAQTDEILGVHMIGANVSDLIQRSRARDGVQRHERGYRDDGALAPDAQRGSKRSSTRGQRPRDSHLTAQAHSISPTASVHR